MFDSDDDRPRSAKPKPRDLTTLSVAELNDYVTQLEAEIARVKLAIEQKQSVRGAAEAMFKPR